MQVSRLWLKAFHPTLWSHPDATKTRRFIPEAISINSHHLKHLRQSDMDLMPFRCTPLVLLELTKTGGEGESEIKIKRRFVQSNPDLKVLLLNGFRRDDLGVADFALFRILDLDCIHGFAIHGPADAGKSSNASMTLPHLVVLRVDINPNENDPLILPRLLQGLVKLTLTLKSLKLTVYGDDGAAAYASLAECLRSAHPLLDDVEIYWNFPPVDLFGAYFVLGLLLACRHLEYVGITAVSPICREIFGVLDSHTWGCPQLEEIEFCLGLWRVGDDDPEDYEYASRDDEI
ncbi:hypothetical protein BGZ47_008839 [Haplosporangium gracile]|nr:hypothetical protein BGZ47_008839 [Haplosporangium gracile]